MYAIPMHKMELKVWVEGIQRVICGVTESTTCQDVVIALAHATGKTGRFTLVERWRDNERLLAPTEPPLRVLHKWGEYACDVQFILRHSDKERHRRGGGGSGSNRGGGGSSSLDQGSKRTEKFLHNFTPHGSLNSGDGGGVYHQQRRSSGSSIRKSLTFSGAHTFFPPMKSSSTSQAPGSTATAQPSANSVNPGKTLASNGPGGGSTVRHSENSSMESLDESASFSSSSSPYASLDKQRRQYAVNRSALGGGSNGGGSLERKVVSSGGGGLRPSPRRSPRPGGVGVGLPGHDHHGHHAPQKTSPQAHQHLPHSVPQPPKTQTPHNTTTAVQSSPYKDSNSKADELHTTTNNNNNIAKVVGTPQEYNLEQGLHNKAQTTSPSHCITPQPTAQHQQASSPRDVTKHNGTLPNAGVSGDTTPTSPSSKKEELLRLVRLQQERLGVQDSQLKILDSEIQYWVCREKDFDQQYQTVQEETSRLQETERALDNSLQELDLVSWVDKLEIEKQQEKMLQSELTLIRSQIANAESELLAVKSKMPGMTSELQEERRKQVNHEAENKEQEIKMLQEISDLQKQINKKLMQYEQNSGSLEQLGTEVKSLESAILEKKTQIADWEKELRAVNMDFFVQTPSTDWLKPPADQGKDKAHGRLSPSRPGSTRKMLHNPQLLKETVATTKNPHGMWV